MYIFGCPKFSQPPSHATTFSCTKLIGTLAIKSMAGAGFGCLLISTVSNLMPFMANDLGNCFRLQTVESINAFSIIYFLFEFESLLKKLILLGSHFIEKYPDTLAENHLRNVNIRKIPATVSPIQNGFK